jgi:biotin carboxyl carrier protein
MPSRAVRTEVAGLVSEVSVKPGDRIDAEEALIVIECMKMLLPCVSPWAGVVQSVRVAVGDMVAEGQVVVDLEV